MGFPCESAEARLVHGRGSLLCLCDTTVLALRKGHNNSNSLIVFTTCKPEREISNLTGSVKLKFGESIWSDRRLRAVVVFNWSAQVPFEVCFAQRTTSVIPNTH